MRNIRIFLLLFLVSLYFASCKSDYHKPDVSNIQVEVKVERFEKDLFSIPKDSISDFLPELSEKYGDFWYVYAGNIMRLGDPDDPGFSSSLSRFLSDPSMKQLYSDCINKYPDFSVPEKELSTAFKYYKYYFPEKSIPHVVTYVSGFSLAIAAMDSILGIGLDMYLGRDYEKYPFHEYQKKKMTAEHIVPACMYGWVTTEFEFIPDKDDLLSNMIYEGKMMYLLDLLLPDMEDSLKIGYTSEQIEWCGKNETDIWKYFVGNNLLYSTNKTEFCKKYFSPAPFTSGFPQDSPGQIGTWLGWQIVRSYMENNSKLSIMELLNNNDAQQVLKDSKYKP